ncbi:MAG: O-antigen ligase family protein [Anaerolineales bacterium]|nr:O-antigen ligase family protein [Anaerolineales bacterium]
MVLKKDYPYILIAVVTSALAATAVFDPGDSLGTFALIGLIGIGVVMTIIINPSLGANVLIIAIFSNISAYLTDNGMPGIIKPLVAVVFGSIVVRNYYIGQIPMNRPKTRRIEIFLILYLIAVSASYLTATDKDLTMERIVDLVKDIVIMYCILFCLRSFKEWKNAITIIIALIVGLCLFGVYQMATGDFEQDFFGLSYVDVDDRLSGPINEPNMWGQVIVFVLPFVIFGFLRSDVKGKFVYAIVFALLIFELLNTYSRGGYLAFFVIIFLIMFFFTRINFLLIGTVVGLLILALPFVPPAYAERFQTLTIFTSNPQTGIYEEGSFRGRTSEIMAGFEMFSDHPIVGIGAANYALNYQKYAQIIGIETRTEQREAHSLYVEIMAETGILGIISFSGFLLALFRGLSNIKSNLMRTRYYAEASTYISAVQVSLISYLFASLFLHGAFLRFFWILSALAMALIQILHELINEQGDSNKREALV